MSQYWKLFLGVAVGVILTDYSLAGGIRPDLALLWQYQTWPNLPQAIVKDQKGRPFLYVATLKGGLHILDISNPNKPPRPAGKVVKGRVAGLDVMYVTQKGDNLYIALGSFFDAKGNKAGLAVVNVKNPRVPKVLSLWTSAKKQRGSAYVLVDGNHAYLGVMDKGVSIFDISNPFRIQHLSTIQPYVHFPRKNPGRIQHPNARGLALRGKLLFVANDAGGLRVLDVSIKRQPKEIGRYINAGMIRKQQAYNNIVLHGPYAFAAIDYAGLEIIDIRNPRAMRQVGWWNPWQAHTLKNLWLNSPGHTNQLALDAKNKLVYLSAGDSELVVVDVSNPRQPKLAAKYGGPKNKLGVWGMTLTKDRIYLSYIFALIPFRGTWSGVKALKR